MQTCPVIPSPAEIRQARELAGLSQTIAANLIYNEQMWKYPNIRWILAHAGGCVPYVSLRRIYDDSPEDPVSGLQTLAAKRHLTQFLRSGVSGTGVESVVEGAGADVGIDERARLVEGYFKEFHEFAGHHYMAPGEGGAPGVPGAAGGGSFSRIGVRAQASTTPIFASGKNDSQMFSNTFLPPG